MSLLFNIRHLEHKTLTLRGELSATQLDLEGVDELIQVTSPIQYDLEVQRYEQSILVQGSLDLTLKCECARCLKPFSQRLHLPDWNCLLPLEGEEKIAIHNDFVDLTPHVREDILLAFPQHPLCDPECSGLLNALPSRDQDPSGASQTSATSSAWAELNKLKL